MFTLRDLVQLWCIIRDQLRGYNVDAIKKGSRMGEQGNEKDPVKFNFVDGPFMEVASSFQLAVHSVFVTHCTQENESEGNCSKC